MELDLEGKYNPNIKLCSICGQEKELTFEHIPPKAAFNSHPVFMKDLRHITKLGGHLYGKSKRRQKGLGDYKLCEECNNNTGAWYASEYVNYVHQLVKQMKENTGNPEAILKLDIRPLNFLKHIIVMMLCADQALGLLRKDINKTNFILDKYSKELSSKIKVYNLITMQPQHVISGLTLIADNIGIRNVAQIVFRPLAFFLIYDSEIPTNGLMEITDYQKFDYDEYKTIHIKADLERLELTN